MLHNVDTYTTESVPLVLINFSVDDISFSKGEIMGFLQNKFLDIAEIRTELQNPHLLYWRRIMLLR